MEGSLNYAAAMAVSEYLGLTSKTTDTDIFHREKKGICPSSDTANILYAVDSREWRTSEKRDMRDQPVFRYSSTFSMWDAQ